MKEYDKNPEIALEQIAQDVRHAIENPIASQGGLPPNIKHIEFGDDFHPLFHRIWQCRGWPGGPRQHIYLTWNYRWDRGQRFWCFFGSHNPVQWWKRGEGDEMVPAGKRCTGCGRKA